MKSALVYTLMFLTIGRGAIAQPAPAADVWRAFAEKLPVGEFVSIRLKTGKSVRGHFLQATGDAMRIKPRTRIPVPMRDIAFGDVESITREKEGMSPGAKVALGVGIGAGAM